MYQEASPVFSDRFVPLRSKLATDHLSSKSLSSKQTTEATSYSQILPTQTKRCMSFATLPQKKSLTDNPVVKFWNNNLNRKKVQAKQIIHVNSHTILQASGVYDNFYLNTLDLSNQGDLCVHVADTTFIRKQDETFTKYQRGLPESKVSCVKFNQDGSILFRADFAGAIQVIDIQYQKIVTTMKPHHNRISCLTNTSPYGLASGSKDFSICHSDLRSKIKTTMTYLGHKQQVCGLDIHNNRIASGANDGQIIIWDLKMAKKLNSLTHHQTAVKALKWCPWRSNILASGGGSKDNRIIIWNDEHQIIEEVVDGKSQVTGLIWRSDYRDLVTSHSGSSQGSYCFVWNSQKKQFSHILKGHRQRIVGVAVNPNYQRQVVTLGADQNIRFYDVKGLTNKDCKTIRKSSSLSNIALK